MTDIARDFTSILNDIRDGKENLYCGKHFYTPSARSAPAPGCADCWRVLYWSIYAKQPDDLRADFAEGLESAITHLIEHEKAGTWDFKPSLKIEIEKE